MELLRTVIGLSFRSAPSRRQCAAPIAKKADAAWLEFVPRPRGAPTNEQCFHQERLCSGVSWLKPSTTLATICRMGVAWSSISAITRPRFSPQLGH